MYENVTQLDTLPRKKIPKAATQLREFSEWILKQSPLEDLLIHQT
jgi:hypothetical protein